MEYWTVTLVCLAAGFIIVIGGSLVSYMGSLVKSAYQLKIEMRAEMDEGQKKIEDAVDKKVRWIKRDLVEEVEKTKTAMQTDNQRKINEFIGTINKRLADCEGAVSRDRLEANNLFEGLRHDITVLDQRYRNFRREQAAGLQAAAAVPPSDGGAPPIEQPLPGRCAGRAA